MEERDPALVARVVARPFEGYARHDVAVSASQVERVTACVLLLALMVLSGVLLGSPARSEYQR